MCPSLSVRRWARALRDTVGQRGRTSSNSTTEQWRPRMTTLSRGSISYTPLILIKLFVQHDKGIQYRGDLKILISKLPPYYTVRSSVQTPVLYCTRRLARRHVPFFHNMDAKAFLRRYTCSLLSTVRWPAQEQQSLSLAISRRPVRISLPPLA